MTKLSIVLLLLTGCAAKKPVHVSAETQTLGARAADFVNQARDVVKTYRADTQAAKYEQDEINKVQADLDSFNTDAPEAELWTEIDQLVADL